MLTALLLLLTAAEAARLPPPLSPRARALIAPVHEAYARVEADQARLPPAQTTSEKLERLLDRDQAGRAALGKVDVALLPESDRQAASLAIFYEISRHDLQDQAALKSLIPAEGWFKQSIYGEKATKAAFLIVQHAVNDQPLMRQTLAKLGEYVALGEAKGGMYALMYDRIALEFDHRPQRYGSQVNCIAGKWTPINLEDPNGVDARRKAVGLTTTEAEYLTHFKDDPCH